MPLCLYESHKVPSPQGCTEGRRVSRPQECAESTEADGNAPIYYSDVVARFLVPRNVLRVLRLTEMHLPTTAMMWAVPGPWRPPVRLSAPNDTDTRYSPAPGHSLTDGHRLATDWRAPLVAHKFDHQPELQASPPLVCPLRLQ
ncbi:hypothetical protein J6590_005847 [Homalodisca vitripennis]|nr:hypothetical protein J6590_005847 [Homalodisca vitripennis]